MRKTILILLSILTFYGCRYNVPPSVKEALSTAEAYMEENPDSALHILQNISHPENLRSQARADYALLYTQACDKTHLLPPTDSLVQTAVNYYKKEKNSINAAKSYFLLRALKAEPQTRYTCHQNVTNSVKEDAEEQQEQTTDANLF